MLTWTRSLSYAVSPSEIKDGKLASQIEFTAQEQPHVHIRDLTVRDRSLRVCLFSPGTLYTVRLRHRFLSAASPWSQWSNGCSGQTEEDAPSAAPAFWRQVQEKEEEGWTRILLLWKPLPHFLANGKVLSYNVTCQKESGVVLENRGSSCEVLDHTRTSCSLLLPTESCFCSLTASNSAGTSPEAQIWLLSIPVYSDPPSRSQIHAVPRDDNSLDVLWTSPADPSLSGFAVEWFAVMERASSSSSLHWDTANRSCTSLLITEGVEPLVRYAVTFQVLYGDRGSGQSRTLYVYTRQGTPSAGPRLEVHEISSNGMELRWRPVPVELLHGFLRNYTLHYTNANQPARRVFVPAQTHHYSLKNLSPGNYDIYIQASTDAGAGEAGPVSNVNIIGSQEISVVAVVVAPVIVTSLALLLMVCLSQHKMVKQKLCHSVPDPSHSSLSHWTPKAPLEVNMKQCATEQKPDISHAEIVLPSESEPQSLESAENFIYQKVFHLHANSSVTHTPFNTQTREKEQVTSPSMEITFKPEYNHQIEALSLCPSIYSTILLSQPLQTLPSSSTSGIHSVIFQFEGERGLAAPLKDLDSPPSSMKEQESRHPSVAERKDGHNPIIPPLHSLSHSPFSFSNVSHPSVLSHSPSPSFLPSQSKSPFHHNITVDFSYCKYSVLCDPYLPAAV
ncbi:interleukin-6 receptor subunit beta-like isoform X2 [Genypterus blacodes]